ncbi:MAG: hypothetical protein ACRCSU_12155, partial [Paracoccaceae bacterium]
MKAEDIRDEKTLRRWLEERPEETRRRDSYSLAQRCVLRVFPVFGRLMANNWFWQADMSVLPALRALLILGIENGQSNGTLSSEVNLAIKEIADLQKKMADPKSTKAPNDRSDQRGQPAIDEAYNVLSAIIQLASIPRHHDSNEIGRIVYLIHTSHGIASSFGFDGNSIYSSIRLDCACIGSSKDLQSTPLWYDQPPMWFAESAGELYLQLKTIGSGEHKFWLRWWNGVLSGKQIDSKVQREVALIPDAVWQAGPGAVAKQINLLIEKNLLKAEATAIRMVLNDLTNDRDSLGRFPHNGPPDDGESPSAIRSKFQEVDKALAKIESELSETNVLPGNLKTLSNELRSAWNALSFKTKVFVGAIFISVSTGFFGAMGEDLYQKVKVD